MFTNSTLACLGFVLIIFFGGWAVFALVIYLRKEAHIFAASLAILFVLCGIILFGDIQKAAERADILEENQQRLAKGFLPLTYRDWKERHPFTSFESDEFNCITE